MAEKKLLLLETSFDVAKKYEEILKESVWRILHKDSLNSFLESMKEADYDVAVVEGGIVPEKIISMVIELKPVIICSDKKPGIENITVIPRNFSGSELVNALGKVSFMKVAGSTVSAEGQDYLIEETISHEKPVVLEPIVEAGEEAEILTPDDSDETVRSSWEIENDGVDSEAETIADNFSPGQLYEEVETAEEKKEAKQDIFEKIDEIDSIIMSISKDVDGKKNDDSPESEKKLEPELPDLAESDGDGADFLFDDDYKYEENGSGQEIGKISDDEDVSSSRVTDFESIMSEDEVKAPVEKDKSEEPEAELETEPETEAVREFQDSFDGMTDPEKDEENEEEEAVELTPEPVEAAPVEVAEKIEEVETEASGVEGDDLKAEFRKWLDENAREIIKEVVEEQLKELYGKK